MALFTYLLLIGIVALMAYQIKQLIHRKIMEKKNFNYYQCSGDEFILINNDTIYHHSSGKKIAISVNKLKNVKISHKLIYIATENISTLFCPKYGVGELAKELLRYSPPNTQIEIEKGLDKSIIESIEHSTSNEMTNPKPDNPKGL